MKVKDYSELEVGQNVWKVEDNYHEVVSYIYEGNNRFIINEQNVDFTIEASLFGDIYDNLDHAKIESYKQYRAKLATEIQKYTVGLTNRRKWLKELETDEIINLKEKFPEEFI